MFDNYNRKLVATWQSHEKLNHREDPFISLSSNLDLPLSEPLFLSRCLNIFHLCLFTFPLTTWSNGTNGIFICGQTHKAVISVLLHQRCSFTPLCLFRIVVPFSFDYSMIIALMKLII